MWNTGGLNYNERPHSLPIDVKGEGFAKRTEKCRIRDSLMGKEVENLDDHCWPKIQDLVDEEMWICSSYPFRHKTTLDCAERMAKLFGNRIMRHLML